MYLLSDMQVVNPLPQSLSMPLMTDPLRVFLVEDSPVIRERLTETISSIEHVEVAGFAETEADAIAGLRAASSDAVVIAILPLFAGVLAAGLPGSTGSHPISITAATSKNNWAKVLKGELDEFSFRMIRHTPFN